MHEFEKGFVGDFITLESIKTLKYKLFDASVFLIHKVFDSFTELVKFLLRYKVVKILAKLDKHNITKLLVIPIG